MDIERFTDTLEDASQISENVAKRLEVTASLVGGIEEALLDHEDTVQQDLKAARTDLIAAQREVEYAIRDLERKTGDDTE